MITKRGVIVLITSGVVGLGVVAVAGPAFAELGPSGGPAATAGPGHGWGRGAGNGMGAGLGGSGNAMRGNGIEGRGGMFLDGSALPASGTLTAQQRSTLVSMTQEEKLAHDLYVALADRYDAAIFDRIALSEAQHLKMMRTLLDRYGIADPTAGKPAGQFPDPAVQATYERLLAQGKTDLRSALAAGQTVEQTDMDDLAKALDGLAAPNITQVYQNLRQASQHHLAAFQRWS